MIRFSMIAAILVWGLCALASGAEEAAPVRVATLLPMAQDALERVPGNAEVVATVRRDLHTPPPGGVLDLGNPHSPSFEQLAGARPDLVVGDRGLHSRHSGPISQLGAEVLLLATGSVDGTFEALEVLGTRVGAGDEMAAATAAARSQLAASRVEGPVPTLALFGAPGSFFVITERTWIGDLLAHQGFENVVAGVRGDERFPGLVALSDEQLATLRPQLVLLVAHGDPREIETAFRERIADGGAWRGLGASADLGVHVLPPALFSANPGLDLPLAAESLRDLSVRETASR